MAITSFTESIALQEGPCAPIDSDPGSTIDGRTTKKCNGWVRGMQLDELVVGSKVAGQTIP